MLIYKPVFNDLFKDTCALAHYQNCQIAYTVLCKGFKHLLRFSSIMQYHQGGIWWVPDSFCSMTMTPEVQPEL